MDVAELTQEYNAKRLLYDSFREQLVSSVRGLTESAANVLRVDSRVKTLSSVAEKAIRMANTTLANVTLANFTDLVGLRIVVNDEDDVREVAEKLIKEIHAFNSRDAQWPDDSRYRSIHLTLSIDEEKAKDSAWSEFRGLTAEIQIKTAFAEAIDNALHQFSYKLFKTSSTVHRWEDIYRKAIPADAKVVSARDEANRLSRIIDEFEQLLENPLVHEKKDIHPFLDKNRFILHPNPERIWSEVPIGLGTEYRMDFLIQEADGEFVLTELENPKHRLVLNNGDFSASLNHAQRQVEDWQDWVEDNISTMQKTYPGIISPRGLVIIGRSRDLSDSDQRKLRRRNINVRGRLKIITYDDLIAGARTYVQSIRRQLG